MASDGSETMQAVLDRFESYASDLSTRLDHGARAGTAGERVRDEAQRLIDEYRGRIEQAGGYAEAEQALEAFREEARRLRP